ncbi:MAG: FeoB-associated Cys-rich membrane protein [Parabacteroides sp.]|nr:FeoB-associated Cys-rich membrane protein [Parabacteroides sp.]
MWQEIAIIIIALTVLFYIGRKIYKFLTHPSKAGDPCCGCTGCSLKDIKKKN